MSPKLALIADDLTGALDTATPFALAGLSVSVAVAAEGLPAALASGAAVVAVNTASRAFDAEAAAARVARVAMELRAAGPGVLFKKVDSRLKGQVAAETAALADVLGLRDIIVAPAIPDQDRFVAGGRVVGRGVDVPIDVAARFACLGPRLTVADAGSQADLDRLAAATDWSRTLAVGARGLGVAFARLIGDPLEPRRAPPAARTLFAIGSRDPITAAQVEALEEAGAVPPPLDAPAGAVPPVARLDLPAVVRCTGAPTGDEAAVAARFGRDVAALVRRVRPDMLMLGGGDTALAVLSALGVATVAPRGESAPGMPWFEIAMGDGQVLACSVKSGGFGDRRTLLALAPRADRDVVPSRAGGVW